MIVYDNAVKNAINTRATCAFAKETGQELQWYYAEDKYRKAIITDKHLREYLAHLPSGQTQQRLGQIPLVLGLPVLVSQNFDVKGGVVNGSRGTVSCIRYCVDDNSCCHLISVVVHINDSSEECIDQLPPHELPILADSSDITFEYPFS